MSPKFKYLHLVILLTVLLAACSPATPTPAPAPTAAPQPTAATQPTTAPQPTSAPAAAAPNGANTPATLTFFGGGGLQSTWNDLATAFHQKYPAITVNVKVEADNTYNTALPRQLVSDNPPDLFWEIDVRSHVKDGLLTNLDSYAKQYGWDTKLPASVLAYGRVNDQGKLGSGSLYVAGGAAGPAVGVFYNKELAAKIGMTEAPKSIAELEALLAKAKAAGLTPIVTSNKDGLIGHLFSLLVGAYTGAQAANDFYFQTSGASINTPAALDGVKVLQKWIQAGYFNADANAIEQQESYGRFAGGQGVFMFQGSWLAPTLDKTFAGKYGFFPFPPKEVGGKYTAMSSNTYYWAIPAKSKNKDAAALFMDFLTSPEAVQIAAKNGFFAAGAVSGTPAPAPLTSSLTDQFQAEYTLVAANDGFFMWHINSSPTLGSVMPAELQLLVAGKATPEEVLAKIQSTYEADIAASK